MLVTSPRGTFTMNRSLLLPPSQTTVWKWISNKTIKQHKQKTHLQTLVQ